MAQQETRPDPFAGMWPKFPWPSGCADPGAAGRTFTRPKPEWRPILEQYLPGYAWPSEPDRAALERVLMGEPFNVRPADFNASLPIGRVVGWLEVKLAEPSRRREGEAIGDRVQARTGPPDRAEMTVTDIAQVGGPMTS